jgi:cytochrome c oxidase assembly factor CtaG
MQSVWQAALASWSIPWAATVVLLFTALLYLRGWYLLRCAGFPLLRPWRAGAFLCGLATLWIALAGPMDVFNGWLLTAHMLQHMMLMMVAPPLILLGAPLIPLVRGMPVFAAREFAGPFLNWRVAQRVGAFMTRPVVALLLMGAVMLGWHIPQFYELALQSEAWHQVEHASFLLASLIFWWPVIQPWPSTSRWPRWTMIPYLLVADLQNTVLSAMLAFSDRVLYKSYLDAPQVFGLSPLRDQAAAGAIMWVLGSAVFLVPAVLIAVQCLTPPGAIKHVERLPKRRPLLEYSWVRLLSKLGLRGRNAEVFSFVVIFVVVGLTFSATALLSGPDGDLDLLAQQEAGDLTVTVYGPAEISIGKNTFGVLVQSSATVAPEDAIVEVTATSADDGRTRRVATARTVSSSNRLLRAAEIDLPVSGPWQIVLRERSSTESAAFNLPPVLASTRSRVGEWVVGLGWLVSVTAMLVTYSRRRRLSPTEATRHSVDAKDRTTSASQHSQSGKSLPELVATRDQHYRN